MRRTRDPELAADLAAETFAVALVAARKYRGDGAPASAWLVGIARNTLFASLRRSRVEDRARRRLGMEPIELDDELLARIERIGGDSRVETLLGAADARAVRRRAGAGARRSRTTPRSRLRLRCSESVIRQRVHRGLDGAAPDLRGGSVMTEFPALREALVAAAARRRRRRRSTGAAVPAARRRRGHRGPGLAAALRARARAGGQAARGCARAGVRRLPARAAGLRRDAGRSGGPGDGRARRGRRFLAQGGPRRFFAAPSTIRGVPSLCLVAVRRKVAAAAGCGPVSSAVREETPPSITIGDVTGVFLPDGSSDLRFIYDNGVGGVSAHNGLSLVLSPGAPLAGTSWTGASGTRYIRYGRPVSQPVRPVDACPKRLEPLPGDALARARRAALIAVDRLFPDATEATVNAAARPLETPCSAAITERSIEVSAAARPAQRPRQAGATRDGGRVHAGLLPAPLMRRRPATRSRTAPAGGCAPGG